MRARTRIQLAHVSIKQLTPQNTILLQNLILGHLFNKFRIFYGRKWSERKQTGSDEMLTPYSPQGREFPDIAT
jgi:hypothetical protein